MSESPLYGGVEAGGTKFNCIVARGPGEILAQRKIPTTHPAETLQKVVDFFAPYCAGGQITIIGIGAFGPCDLDPPSPTYGYVTSTPKPGWHNTDIVRAIGSPLGVRIAFDTDVNVAALGEYVWGASAGTYSSLYLTIGTGIGGGLIVAGAPMHGLTHPEMGHIRIPHDQQRDPFPGSCPYHSDCFEGLASGTALQARFGRGGEALSDDDPFWDLESEYIGAALANYILTISPQRIVLGGGIMQRLVLWPRIHQAVVRLLAGYVHHDAIAQGIAGFLVPPALGQQSGVLGAIALAASASIS